MSPFYSLILFCCQFGLSIVSEPMTDESILEFVRQRSEANRITRSMTYLDYQTMMSCAAPREIAVGPPSPHMSRAIHVYSNAVGFTPMWDPFETFPEGSLIIKEKFDPFTPQDPELFTGMLKREKGFAPEIGDWEFFTVDGQAKQVTARGKIESCITCHRRYATSDFVTKTYAARALTPFSSPNRLTEKQGEQWTYVKRPVCWSGGNTVILPAAWAIPTGKSLARPDAISKWHQTEQQSKAVSGDLISPPEDLTPWGGPKLRYESSAEKNTLGYWTEVTDSAYWIFQVTHSGKYEVQVNQGCGSGHGGSVVEVTVGTQNLSWVVEDTGHFQNFKWKTIGNLELSGDDTHQLIVKPQSKAAGAVVDVRQIRLVKVEE